MLFRRTGPRVSPAGVFCCVGMFKNLSDRLTGILNRLKKRGALREEDVTEALREVRIALLEADVALPVVKELVSQIRERALGQEVLQSVTPGQMVVKIVHDHLVATLGGEASPLDLATTPPAVIMMVGLQGSGKTTTTAKLARFLTTQHRKKVLMVGADAYRPAAREQLATLGADIGVETLPIIETEVPLESVKRGHEKARLEGFDVLLIDTAGRLHKDEALMGELQAFEAFLKPTETLLVVDGMTGQDALTVAQDFSKKLTLTGVILTRLDGDARGGAALSMRSVTGCPIKFVGVGERSDHLDTFHPERIVNRILDMGDVVSLVEKAAQTMEQDEAEALAKKMQAGQFTLDDMEKQLVQITKMGGVGSLMEMLPGMGRLKEKAQEMGLENKATAHQIAIIRSMTPQERGNVKILNASRRRRIAFGSGTTVQEVNKLVKSFIEMGRMMKQMKKLGKRGLAQQGMRALLKR